MRQADDNDFSLLETLILNGIIDSKQKIYKEQIRKKAELAKIKGRKRSKKRRD